jgi:hypothetical protein
MRFPYLILCALLASFALFPHPAGAQDSPFNLPETVEAGNKLQISTSGSGPATLYIAGPAGAWSRTFELGQTIALGGAELHNAGDYMAVVITKRGSSSRQFRVRPAKDIASISFLAKPSRLPVRMQGAVSGVAYVFDAFGNLVLESRDVTFILSDLMGAPQSRTVKSRLGVAWAKMNSANKAGLATFEAVSQNVREKRVIQEVAGDPCSLRMSARPAGQRVLLETEPVRDCSGNPVPDGTIVTFTQSYGKEQSTVDVPLKRGIARTEMPSRAGAVISVASGVVMGNEIRWGGGS